MRVEPITIWRRFNGKSYEHNHIENGHSLTDKPIPKFESQKSWLSYQWQKQFAHLVNGKVKSTVSMRS